MEDNKKIIDVWMQHPGTKFLSNEMFEPLRRWGRLSEMDLPVELTETVMEEANIRLGLLSAWEGPQGSLISNEEVHKIVNSRPKRFKGIASVNISKPMEAIEQLQVSVQNYGFVGLRILPWLWELPCNDRRYYPLYVECIRLDIPFCLQVRNLLNCK
jgi:predicted TIM-barrel fold metal-dependent hydrolase